MPRTRAHLALALAVHLGALPAGIGLLSGWYVAAVMQGVEAAQTQP